MCVPAFASEKPVCEWTFNPAPENVKTSAGVSGNAGVFSGNFQISVPASDVPEGMTQISFTAWVKPGNLSEFREILRKEDGDFRLLFSFQNSGKILSMGLNLGGEYVEFDAPMNPDALKDGKWHFVCGTYDGKTAAVWLDACRVLASNVSADWKYGGTAPLFLGSNGNSEFYDGQLDEVRLYDRALSFRDIHEEFTRFGGTFDVSSLQNQVREMKAMAVEYEPRTPEQWAKCTEEEKTQWKRREAEIMKYNAESTDAAELFEQLEALREFVVLRPHHQESVAPFHPAFTPEVKDLTQEEAAQKLEEEWLFQCDNHPTRDAAKNEIRYARKLAARMHGIDFSQALKALDALDAKLETMTDSADENEIRTSYLKVRTIKREIFFSNPAIDFNTILYIDAPYPEGSEWRHENHHRVGTKAVPGGRLMTLTGLSPAGKQKKLMPDEAFFSGSFWRPDVSYDGKRVLFCFKPYNEKSFHLYEMNADGTDVRQLTDGAFDDLDPVYLPDGENIMFLTGRAHTYVRCVVSANSFVMARMKLHGKPEDGIYILSRNMECEYTPCVMNDGRVLYTRWEYTDKPLWRCQSLWTMNPDGTQVQTFWGNQSVWPDLLKDARPLPGSERVLFTGSGHHNWFGGSLGIIDPGKGLNYPDGLTKVTQEVPWTEVGDGPEERPASSDYHTSGNYVQYSCPYPLSDRDFLVSAQRGDKFVLLLMDVDGNRELIYEGFFNIFHAIPLRPRAVPQARQDQTLWPTLAERETPAAGIIYSNNVYDNAPPELKDKARFLRVWSQEPKTYTMWDHRPYASMGPATSMVQSDGVKRILGTVPIEDDGSVNFEAPSGVALHFQLLDENHRALQTMRSFTGVMPGEVRGCLGCHESQIVSPNLAPVGKAMRRAPSKITPVPWEDVSVSYGRYVQPVLDKYCGKCHENPDSKAYETFNMTRRPGFRIFDEPYVTLVGRPSWGAQYKAPDNPPPGFGWADTILVEGYDQRDPAAYHTVAPLTKLSYKSRLVERMASGTHHDVKVTGDDLLRVILWVDAMCPYYGSEELRNMPDPEFPGADWLPVRPRIQTAPVIPRPGPFDAFHPENDRAYDAPDMNRVNRLPYGIQNRKP